MISTGATAAASAAAGLSSAQPQPGSGWTSAACKLAAWETDDLPMPHACLSAYTRQHSVSRRLPTRLGVQPLHGALQALHLVELDLCT